MKNRIKKIKKFISKYSESNWQTFIVITSLVIIISEIIQLIF